MVSIDLFLRPIHCSTMHETSEINFFCHDILSFMGEVKCKPAMSISLEHFHFFTSLYFIHKNEQILLIDETFLTHQGKGKLFNEFN